MSMTPHFDYYIFIIFKYQIVYCITIVMDQMPGTPMYSLALYYMIKTPLEDNPLLQNFVDGDDTYRNSRFKLIPYISKVKHMSKI